MKNKVVIAIAVLALAGSGFYFLAGNKNAPPTQAGAGVSTSDIAPSFTLTTINGKTVHSADLRGKIVVMSSAAQWCPTCQEEAKEFAPVYEKYQGKPVVFITIDIDPRDTIQSIEQFKKTYDTPWDYADAQGGAEIIRKYAMNRFEMTFIINQNGKLVFNGDVLTRPEELDAEIQKLL